MILYNEPIGNIVCNTLVEFGHGDVRVDSAFGITKDDQNYSAVIFKSMDDELPIGTKIKNEAVDTDSWKPEIMFVFTKKESIDVIIEKLEEAKKYLT